ncbi:MAG: sulfite oxidase-like oxidoreductase [Motilibacteraceae bacterium]
MSGRPRKEVHPNDDVVTLRPTPDQADRVPPGQRLARGWPVLHYGPVPRFRPERWDLRVFGRTASGEDARLTWPEVELLPHGDLVADFHCVTKFSILDNRWEGVLADDLLAVCPPAPDVEHVLVWAEYGYSANVPLDALRAGIFARRRNGEPLDAEHGAPLRLVVPSLYGWKGPKWVRGVEYLERDRPGFWEERGYHNVGDPWREQRYAGQEEDAERPGRRGRLLGSV